MIICSCNVLSDHEVRIAMSTAAPPRTTGEFFRYLGCIAQCGRCAWSPYSSAALRHDLERVRGIWDECQAHRDRDAIYAYLTAVYDLVAWWTAEGREIDRTHRALRLQRLAVSDREDPFAAIIRCTADPAKADKRTKWSRVMRHAAAYKPDSEPLDQFIKRKGGINACAARFSRRLGQGLRTGRR
jgi:bacterioferritin-associated ferredoxin